MLHMQSHSLFISRISHNYKIIIVSVIFKRFFYCVSLHVNDVRIIKLKTKRMTQNDIAQWLYLKTTSAQLYNGSGHDLIENHNYGTVIYEIVHSWKWRKMKMWGKKGQTERTLRSSPELACRQWPLLKSGLLLATIVTVGVRYPWPTANSVQASIINRNHISNEKLFITRQIESRIKNYLKGQNRSFDFWSLSPEKWSGSIGYLTYFLFGLRFRSFLRITFYLKLIAFSDWK